MCYSEWHHQIQLHKGIHARRVKNFEKARAKDTWPFFEKLAHMCNKNAGSVDFKLYITSLVDHHKGYVPPKVLPTLKSIKIYKSYIRSINLENDPEEVKKSILNSLTFVVKYIKDNNLDSLDSYLYENVNIIPTILKHYNAGSVCVHFLCCIKNFSLIISGYPDDVVNEFLPDFEEKYNTYRPRLVSSDDKNMKIIINNLEDLVKRALEN